jgi:hypothetical protein
MARKTTSTTTKATSETKAKPRRTAAAKAKPTIAEPTPASSVIQQQRKPVFRAGTWVAVLLLIALIGLTFYLKSAKEKSAIADATPISAPVALFSAEDGAVTSIEIKPAEGEAVKVARNAENAWAVEMPIAAEANQGLVEAAATQVSALQVLSQIENANPEIFGLKNPAFVIALEFQNGNKHTLEVGDATPTNTGFYVRLDNGKIMIADLSGISALLQLAYSPPYLNTPTPTALPSTPTVFPAATETPTPVP